MQTPDSSQDPPSAPAAPATIVFSCWSCALHITVPAHMAGVTGPCPRCGSSLTAPSPFFSMTTPEVEIYHEEELMPVEQAQAAPPPPPSPLMSSLAQGLALSPLSASAGAGAARASYPVPVLPPLPSTKTDGARESGPALQIWRALPVGAYSILGGLVGGAVGCVVAVINSLVYRRLRSPALRNIVCGTITFGGVAPLLLLLGTLAAIIDPSILKEALKQGTVASDGKAAGVTASSPRHAQFAIMKKLVQAKAPGTYTDTDFAAAEKAALAAATDETALQAYAQVLKSRLRR